MRAAIGALVLLSSLGALPARAEWTRELELTHGAFSIDGAPEAIVHAPADIRADEPLHVVLFLHGYRGCARVLAYTGDAVRCRAGARAQRGWGLLDAHDAAGTRSVMIVAQLAFDARDGSPGRFGRVGGVAAFLDEVLAALTSELGARRASDIASLTLLAHSAAFESSLAVIRHGGVEDQLRSVVLLDALYAGGPAFLAWARQDEARRLVVLFTGGRTAERSRALARSAGELAALEPDDGLASDRRVVVVHARVAHGDVPARYIPEVLRTLRLPRR